MNKKDINRLYRSCTQDESLRSIAESYKPTDSVFVSILCLCYNHEKYIERCLEGFLKQKVNFNVEIIIHDDCSSDSSKKIIEEYKFKYPNVFRTVFECENQYKKGVNIENTILSKLIRGKYVMICESDDYWIDPFKIAFQVRALQFNDNCRFVSHATRNEDILGEKIGRIPKKFSTGCYNREEVLPLLLENYMFHTTSFCFRASDYLDYCKNLPLFASNMSVGDYALALFFTNLGETVYLNKLMSAHVDQVPGSWTDKNRNKPLYLKREHQKNMISCFSLFNEYTNHDFEGSFLKRLHEYEMFILADRGDYSSIISNRSYSNALKKNDKRTYYSAKLRIKHPNIYSIIKKVANYGKR